MLQWILLHRYQFLHVDMIQFILLLIDIHAMLDLYHVIVILMHIKQPNYSLSIGYVNMECPIK